MEGLQKVGRWLLDADDGPNSHQNIIISFWPTYNVPWNLHANSFRGICIKTLSRQINKQKVCENNNLLCAGNKVLLASLETSFQA